MHSDNRYLRLGFPYAACSIADATRRIRTNDLCASADEVIDEAAGVHCRVWRRSDALCVRPLGRCHRMPHLSVLMAVAKNNPMALPWVTALADRGGCNGMV